MGNLKQRNGILAPFIWDFLRMRRNLGFKSISTGYSLFAFDDFANRKGLASITITKELADEWCQRRPNEATDTWSHRNCFLRQFSIYIFNIGYETYIPLKLPSKHDDTFIPYIYSDRELRDIYRTCDSLVLYDKHARSTLMILPALVRMLAGTGIRIGEALNLHCNDVDLEQNYLVLKGCKNGKDRIVPISGSLADVCAQYRKYRELLPRHSDYFFVKLNGRACVGKSFSYWWKTILKKAGIKQRGDIVGPRIQDLRHSFCVNSMSRLSRKGNDLYYILPILSTYVGHQSLAATDGYVRMTSEMYPDLLNKIDGICSYIYPKLKYRN
ncbi:MAG: tyrosine-type recombinase/integrase [Spirochaetales bacterium]|jgi:integrase/recombinase XerD|nr:tyrosine-type recombinase/integrase [Spirochaetales bacterium]